MANGQFSVEFHIDDWATPGLPGMTPERIAWTMARVGELYAAGHSFKDAKKIIRAEAKGEPWKAK